MIRKYKHGSCSFILIEQYESVENAANNKNGKFVEIKLNDYKIEFSKVRREDDKSHTEDPKARGHSKERV